MPLPLSYNWKNLLVRRTTTMLTVLVISVVVGVFAWMMSFRLTLERSLSFASDSGKLIILRKGATSETNSAIATEDFNKLTQLNAELALDPVTREQLSSPEILVQVYRARLTDGGRTSANVAVRGVTDRALAVHQNVRLLGRPLQQGALEVIVGQAAARQFSGLNVGDVINLGFSGNRGYRVVGHFTADGGPMESEIWAPLTMLRDSYRRDLYSSVNVRLAAGMNASDVISRIEGPAINLTAMTEPTYWREQTRNIRIYLGIVSALVGVMCAAAAFAIANTMYAAVAARRREFAMLRTLGFSRGQILTSVLVEACLLSLAGALVGCAAAAAWLQFVGYRKDMFGASTFTTLAFEIQLSSATLISAVGVVVLMASIGSMFPALRAARTEVIQALRDA